MKKIFLMMALAGAAFGFSSCTETWDGNPVLKTHEGAPEVEILNNPVLQSSYISLDADKADGTIRLTCSQPDYGYAAIATYKVQLSLTEDFAEYQEIPQSFYNCAAIEPTNKDFASSFEKLYGIETEDQMAPVMTYQPIYVRLRSYIAQSPNNTEYLSNVVKFDNIRATFFAVWIPDQPADLYIRGGMNDWGVSPEWQFFTAAEENTWIVKDVTIDANVSIKVSTATWGYPNLGGNAGENDDSEMINAGEQYKMTVGDNPGHMRLKEDFTGNVILQLKGEDYYITFEPVE